VVLKKTTIHIALSCLAAYIIILFRQGYIFGSGDHSEVLPYAKYLNDNSLYTKDFYIQSISQHIPNERYFFSWFMSLFGNYMEVAAFLLHAIATFLLIYGLFRLSKKWLLTEGGQWIATIAPVLFLYNINLGGNELYYNLLVPSYLAQVLGVWIFVFIAEAKFWHAYPLLILATYVHPLIGVQLWILITLLLLKAAFEERNVAGMILFFLPTLLYLALVGKYLFDIRQGYNNALTDPRHFIEILEFRVAHHYFPQYYSLKAGLILLPLWALLYYLSKAFLKILIGVIVFGLLVYIIGVLVLKNILIINMHWFGTTIWLKTFAIMFLVGFIEDILNKNKWWQYVNDKKLIVKGLYISSFICLISMTPQLRLFKSKPYDFYFLKNETPEKDIALQARHVTPKDALFLIPADLSEFRYWSERSSYIDYKATNHRKAAFAEWYDRIQQIYKINIQNRFNGDDLIATAKQNYQALREADILQIAEKHGITHMITFKTHSFSLKKLYENEKYTLYRLHN
jgi:hypothetical protein